MPAAENNSEKREIGVCGFHIVPAFSCWWHFVSIVPSGVCVSCVSLCEVGREWVERFIVEKGSVRKVRCVRESGLWVVCAIVILAICDMDSPGVVHLEFLSSFLIVLGWRGRGIYFFFIF